MGTLGADANAADSELLRLEAVNPETGLVLQQPVRDRVGTFSNWRSGPLAQELLTREVPQIARDYEARYNRGERFWFTWIGDEEDNWRVARGWRFLR